MFRRAMNLSRPSHAARCAALSLLALLVLAPAAHARKPVTLSVAGRDPDVAVDAAGTGHFVWSSTDGEVTTTHYCRVGRSGRGCAAGSERTFLPGGAPPPQTGGNEDFAGPRVFVSGATVYVVTTRCCGVPGTPIGFSEGTFVFTSPDGGSTFDGGALIGNVGPDDAVLLPGALFIATGTSGQGGAAVQAAPLGGPPTEAEADLLPGRTLIAKTLGFAGATLVGAFSDGKHAFTARLNAPPPNANDPAQWSAVPDGSYRDVASLAGGKAGLYALVESKGSRIGWRKYSAKRGKFGGSHTIAQRFSIFENGSQDPSGRLHAVWVSGNGIWYSRKPRGKRYQRRHRVARGSRFFSLQVAANGQGPRLGRLGLQHPGQGRRDRGRLGLGRHRAHPAGGAVAPDARGGRLRLRRTACPGGRAARCPR
jgi:hypothetical protein